jgi:hypothetical protein
MQKVLNREPFEIKELKLPFLDYHANTLNGKEKRKLRKNEASKAFCVDKLWNLSRLRSSKKLYFREIK